MATVKITTAHTPPIAEAILKLNKEEVEGLTALLSSGVDYEVLIKLKLVDLEKLLHTNVPINNSFVFTPAKIKEE